MIRFLFVQFAVLLMAAFLISCNEKEDVTPETVKSASAERRMCSKVREMFSGKSRKVWQAKKAMVFGTDVSGTVVPFCSLDNLLVLHKNGKYMEFEGPSKCEEDDSYLYGKGSWSVEGNILTLDIEEGIFKYEIMDLSEKEVVVRMLGDFPLELYLTCEKSVKPF